MLNAILIRLMSDENQTLGVFQMFDGEKLIFECKSLELPWKDNLRRVSCIPVGCYETKLREHGRYANKSLHVSHLNHDEVMGRSHILIHAGNYKKNTKGCILLGKSFADINKDGLLDITSSNDTIKQLLEISDTFKLKIIDVC